MHALVNLIQRHVLSKAGSTGIALFVIMALVWYAGPSVGLASIGIRIIIITSLIVTIIIVWSISRVVIARRGELLRDDLSKQNDSRGSSKKLEIQLLKEKMNEAIFSLKSSELGAKYRGNAALYALPWYMIIGPSAAGKSTLLRQSGLHFPYSNEEDIHIKGYGGTRNCDWWFSDQAVILDTAGRYTTEDDDRDEWVSFLGLLRKHRKKMPINGVLVAISLPELLTADKNGLDWHVKIIRNRINELVHQLGMVFPVHVVFTKCDLLKGFDSFFEDMSEQERAQVWGSYLYDKYNDNVSISEIFSINLHTLYCRLCAIRLRKVSMQRNITRKSEMFDFPNQFKASSERVREFINLLFKNNPYQETPQFAGVYFTSATQEGTPIERVIGSLRQAFGLTQKTTEKNVKQQRPYFIKNLFTDVIFQIQGGIRASRRRLNYHKVIKTGSVIASLLLLGATYLLLSGSYVTNSYVLNHGEKMSHAVSEDITSPITSMHTSYLSISGLYDHYLELSKDNSTKQFISKTVLYRANEQLDSINKVLLEGLKNVYWMSVVNEIENRLSNYSKQWIDANNEQREAIRSDYYDLLALYLRLTQAGRFDFDLVLQSTQRIWYELIIRDGGMNQESLAQLEKLSKYYLETKVNDTQPYWIADNALVNKAQAQLRVLPDAKILYAQLISIASKRWKDIVFDDLVVKYGSEYINTNKKLIGIYTADAWYQTIKPGIDNIVKTINEGDWVLDSMPINSNAGEKNYSQIVQVEAKFGKHDEQTMSEMFEEDKEYKQLEANSDTLGEVIALQIRKQYFKEYSEEWHAYLKSIHYKLPSDLKEKSRAFMILSSEDGPISNIFKVLSNNVLLYEENPSTMDNRKLSTGEVETELNRKPKRVPELKQEFSDLENFSTTRGVNNNDTKLSEYLKILKNVFNEVDGITASVDVGRDSERFVSKILSGESTSSHISTAWVTTTAMVNSVQSESRQILDQLLSPPLRMAWAGIVSQASSELETEWSTSVIKPYKNMILNKFPFYKSGDDAALTDVAEFYRPGDGILWLFVNTRLTPYLRHTSKGWEPRKWLGTGVTFSQGFLDGLDKAQKITDALYTYQDDKPNMTFYLQPDPDSGLREMQLESNGQLYRYRNGPQEWQRFDWPGDLEQIGARVMGIADNGRAIGELRSDGPWGLFHLLSQADIKKVGGGHYRTSWKLPSSDGESVTVAFKLRADREDNIFNLKQIHSFRLPASLFSNSRSDRLASY